MKHPAKWQQDNESLWNRTVVAAMRALFLSAHAFFPNDTSDLKEDISAGHIKRILVVATTAIGDTLMCTPAIRALKQTYRHAHISLLVHKRREALLGGNPNIDSVISYPGKFKGLAKLVRELRRGNFDMAVVLHANDPDILPLVYLSGARHRIGWAESRFSFLLTVAASPDETDMHFINRRLLISQAGGAEPGNTVMELYVSPRDEVEAGEFLKQHGVNEKDVLIGLHPGASRPARCWVVERFSLVADELISRCRVRIVVIGDQKSAAMAGLIKSISRNKLIVAAGKLELKASAALIKRMSLLVTTDSGPMHMAIALGTPVVALFGPGDKNIAGPLTGVGMHRVIQKDVNCPRPCRVRTCPLEKHECMEKISVSDVVRSAIEVLKSSPGAS